MTEDLEHPADVRNGDVGETGEPDPANQPVADDPTDPQGEPGDSVEPGADVS